MTRHTVPRIYQKCSLCPRLTHSRTGICSRHPQSLPTTTSSYDALGRRYQPCSFVNPLTLARCPYQTRAATQICGRHPTNPKKIPENYLASGEPLDYNQDDYNPSTHPHQYLVCKHCRPSIAHLVSTQHYIRHHELLHNWCKIPSNPREPQCYLSPPR